MKDDSDHREPPVFGTFILKKIYGENLFSDVYGDLREIYVDNVRSRGAFIASLKYLLDVLLSVRNYDLKSKRRKTQNNAGAMLKNYFKITLRTISKNKIYSGLNIMGLALGIAACLFILQYVSYERSYDKFHEWHEDLYRVRYKVTRGEELQIDCAAAVPRVGPFMKEKMPEVVDFARAYPISGVVTYEDQKYFEDRMHIADPAFLQIFTFPLVQGNAETALTEPFTVVISESAAKKYFGNDDPMGKMIRMDGEHSLSVTGVAKDVPEHSHIKFDFLVSYETLNVQTRQDDGSSSSETAWGWYDFNTYVRLKPGSKVTEFDSRFAEYLYDERGEEFEKYDYKQEFPLQPVTSIHLYSNLLQESEPEEQGDGEAVFFLTIIAFFILVIAWINYINLSTARSIERAKEVGVRKTMGAYRDQLVKQFLAEAFILNLFALILGLVIVIAGIGYFNRLTGSLLNTSFLSDPFFWLILVGIYFVGSLLSGLYPAFILSSFKPSAVLKGKLSSNKAGNTLRRILVIFQFAASVTLIAGTIIVYRQLAYMTNTDLGFDMTETLVVKGPEVFGADSLYESTMKTFKSELLKNPEIISVSSSSNVPGDEIFWTRGTKKQEDTDDRFMTTYIVGVDYDYFPTYDIEILAGRNFDPKFRTDTGSILLNKTAVLALGFESPDAAINQKVTYAGDQMTVIGVVDDYNQLSLKAKVNPILFQLYLNGSSYFTLKLGDGNYARAFDIAEGEYTDFFPGNPFDYFFLDDFYNRQYQNERKFSKVFSLFAGFAIIVACLGLFGLSSFSALQKTKEIGIRKAIGADIGSIVLLLSKEFFVLILVANVISWPIIYMIMNNWLDNFASRIDIGIWTFIISGLILVLIAALTVGYKTITTARSNPVTALRYE